MSPVNAWWWAAQLVTVGVVVVGVATAEQPSSLRGLRRARQASNPDIVCLLEVSAGLRDHCDEQCTCDRYWHCKDNDTGRPEAITGGLVNAVDLKSGASILCQHPEDVCCFDIDTTLPPPDIDTNFIPQCGQHNANGVGANLLGFTDRQAQFGELPWMTLIRRSDMPLEVDHNGLVGGGSLISDNIVMTAVHVIQRFQAQQLLVRLGEWNLESRTEPVDYQEIPVSRVLHHPQYNARNVEYDVALLILERPAQLGRTVDTICLPTPGQTFDGLRCISSGWGKDSFGKEGKYQQILKSIDLPAVSHASCQSALRTTHLGSDFRLHKSFMCAGGEAGKDVCTGDGGSPLVCPSPQDPTTYVQAGIVAWGIGCGTEGIPGVYVDIPEVLPWVNQVLTATSQLNPRSGHL